jgi:iron uptake system component EfeO
MPSTHAVPVRRRAAALLGAAVAAPVLLAGCTSASGSTEGAAGAITVAATDSTCTLSTTTAPAGVVTFRVTNSGGQMNEFYVYDEAGTTILAEVENIGPGLTRELTAELPAGTVTTACRPNGTGEGIRAAFTVSASTASPSATSDALAAAVADYREFVAEESAALLASTQQFVAAVKAGDVAAAKALYPTTRVHWERIEPVAESFAELDPKLDARENDVEPGTEWTGWHRIEKALWADKSLAGMEKYADQLLADTKELVGKIPTVSITPTLLGNGATELLQEVATGKVTGEEERYSRTDLWDFQANVDGAQRAFTALGPVILAKDPDLHARITSRFAALQAELASHARGEGFVLYDALTKAQVRELADKVDALAEPLSQVTAVVVR